MKKKLVSLVLALVLVLGCLPLAASAGGGIEGPEHDPDTSGENATWSFTEQTGTLSITGTGAMWDYDANGHYAPWCEHGSRDIHEKIKSVVVGEGITAIGSFAFYGLPCVESISLPSTLKEIRSEAFAHCTVLPSITIPDGVTSIGNYAFQRLQKLASLSLPSSVRTIGDDAFRDCSSLATLNLPEGLETIGDRCFIDCSSVSKLTLPTTLTSVGSYAFSGTQLTEIHISEKLSQISNSFDCETLRTITVDENNESFKVDNGILYSKDGTTLVCYPLAKPDTHFTVPKEVTRLNGIDFGKFREKSNVTSLSVEDGNNQFIEIDGILYKTSYGTTKPEELFMASKSVSGKVIIPSSVTCINTSERFIYCNVTEFEAENNQMYFADGGALYAKASSWSSHTDETTGEMIYEPTDDNQYLIRCPSAKKGAFSLAAGTKEISPEAFYNCDGITSIGLPAEFIIDSSSSFNFEQKFKGCSNLEEFVIAAGNSTGVSKDGCIYINGGKELFYCPVAKSTITIPDGVTSIGDSGWSDCKNLEYVIIPSSVTNIPFWIGNGREDGKKIIIYGDKGSAAEAFAKENSNYYIFKTENPNAPKPTLTGKVNITGTEKFGQTLRASVSGDNSPSNAFTYTWKRGGSTIATGAAYTLAEADVGQTLTCEVTASDCTGVISKTTGVIGKTAGPAAPGGLEGVCPTAAGTSDGKIIGTTTAMEYSSDRSFTSPAGTPCSANETTGLAPGTYYVRMAATATTEAGAVTTITVPVYVAPEVTAVTVSPVNAQVKKGSTKQFIATVSGKGAYDRTVIWDVSGGAEGTSISSAGLLTVSAEEEASTVLTVTATSAGDGTKKGTTTVTVVDSLPTPPINPSDPEPTVETVTTEDGNTATVTTQPEGDKEIEVKTPSGETVAKVNLPADPGEGKKFADVKDGDWYQEAVDSATAYGLFNGTSETKFSPNSPMTRGMLATVLYNLSGKSQYGVGEGAFADVAENIWYENAVDWAAKTGVTSGTGSGGFSPEQKITREQMVTMLYRYAKLIGADTKKTAGLEKFPDAGQVSDYAKEAAQWAVAEGFISGRASGGKDYIAPRGTATRAEVAAVLTRFVEFLK